MDEVDPAKGDVTKEVVGQTKEDTAVSDLDARQIDTPQTVKDAPTRKIEEGEMIDETPVVDQERVKEETQATAHLFKMNYPLSWLSLMMVKHLHGRQEVCVKRIKFSGQRTWCIITGRTGSYTGRYGSRFYRLHRLMRQTNSK